MRVINCNCCCLCSIAKNTKRACFQHKVFSSVVCFMDREGCEVLEFFREEYGSVLYWFQYFFFFWRFHILSLVPLMNVRDRPSWLGLTVEGLKRASHRNVVLSPVTVLLRVWTCFWYETFVYRHTLSLVGKWKVFKWVRVLSDASSG